MVNLLRWVHVSTGIAERMYKNFPEIFKGQVEIDARSTVVIRCILSMMAECNQLQALNPKLRFKNDASYHDMYYMNFSGDSHIKEMRKSPEVKAAKEAIRKEHIHPERLMKTLFANTDYLKWKVDAGELMTSLSMWQVICRVMILVWSFILFYKSRVLRFVAVE